MHIPYFGIQFSGYALRSCEYGRFLVEECSPVVYVPPQRNLIGYHSYKECPAVVPAFQQTAHYMLHRYVFCSELAPELEHEKVHGAVLKPVIYLSAQEILNIFKVQVH